MSLTRACFVVAALASLSSSCAAVVVVNDNIGFSGPYGGSTPVNTDEYGIGIAQDAVDSTGTGANFFFNYVDYTIRPSLFLADEGVDLYLVQEGDVFSSHAITSGQIPIVGQSTDPGISNTLFVGQNNYFYLGLATELSDGPYLPETRDVFGWAKITLAPGSDRFLIMESNAVAYNERGIIVGTAQVVPEPSTLLLVIPLTIFLGAVRKQPKV